MEDKISWFWRIGSKIREWKSARRSRIKLYFIYFWLKPNGPGIGFEGIKNIFSEAENFYINAFKKNKVKIVYLKNQYNEKINAFYMFGSTQFLFLHLPVRLS